MEIIGNKIYGIEIGEVVELKRESSSVKVKLELLSQEHITNWAPVAGFMAGPGRGAYFMPEVHDKVAVMFMHGNRNEPIVIGSIWTEDQKPPESRLNKDADVNKDGKNNMRIIKSKSGHMVIMDDTPGKEKIQIIDSSNNNKLEMICADKSKDQKINIVCAKGSMSIEAPEGSINIKCEKLNLEVKETLNINSGGAIKIEGKDAFELSAGKEAKIDAQNLNLKGSASVELSGGNVQLKGSSAIGVKSTGLTEIAGSPVKIN